MRNYKMKCPVGLNQNTLECRGIEAMNKPGIYQDILSGA